MSAMKDHGKSDMHQMAMCLYNKYQAEGVTDYATRFTAHKVAAINQLLDKYTAYIAHLCSLIEDPSVKQVDKRLS